VAPNRGLSTKDKTHTGKGGIETTLGAYIAQITKDGYSLPREVYDFENDERGGFGRYTGPVLRQIIPMAKGVANRDYGAIRAAGSYFGTPENPDNLYAPSTAYHVNFDPDVLAQYAAEE